MMRLRIQGPFSALPKGQQGSVMVLLVIALAFILPVFRSTVPRESLGRQPETAVTPEITPC
jgi:hypothetical protein